jgi:hypothetical protein
MPFTPEYSLPTLRYFYDQFRTNIWTGYGFRDAFNLTANWWDPDVLGIDQGPILIMLENHRTQKVWRLFMQVPEIQRGLQTAGFVKLPFVPLGAQSGPGPGVFTVSWEALGGRSYQVEYSPNLLNWFGSPTGFLIGTAAGTTLSWEDNGPPATDAIPLNVPRRFYRVFQLGAR